MQLPTSIRGACTHTLVHKSFVPLTREKATSLLTAVLSTHIPRETIALLTHKVMRDLKCFDTRGTCCTMCMRTMQGFDETPCFELSCGHLLCTRCYFLCGTRVLYCQAVKCILDAKTSCVPDQNLLDLRTKNPNPWPLDFVVRDPAVPHSRQRSCTFCTMPYNPDVCLGANVFSPLPKAAFLLCGCNTCRIKPINEQNYYCSDRCAALHHNKETRTEPSARVSVNAVGDRIEFACSRPLVRPIPWGYGAGLADTCLTAWLRYETVSHDTVLTPADWLFFGDEPRAHRLQAMLDSGVSLTAWDTQWLSSSLVTTLPPAAMSVADAVAPPPSSAMLATPPTTKSADELVAPGAPRRLPSKRGSRTHRIGTQAAALVQRGVATQYEDAYLEESSDSSEDLCNPRPRAHQVMSALLGTSGKPPAVALLTDIGSGYRSVAPAPAVSGEFCVQYKPTP